MLPALLGQLSLFLLVLLLLEKPASANIPGGGTGAGPNVTIVDNGSTVTMANGIISIVITKTSAEIHTLNYTYNNSGTAVTNQLLAGGSSGGVLYWFQNGGTFIAGPFTQSVVANNGNYAEISLAYASPSNGVMDIHYSMLRGSPGFYTTAILTHRGQDGVIHIELRPNIYAGSQFNWMSVDATRNRLMQVSGGSSVGVPGAPVECSLWTSGIFSGQYEDKYKYSADLAGLSAWGWSSVGTGGKNVGLWNVTASPEYYPGGPMERSLMEHIGTTILNVFTGGYYGLGTDDTFTDGELWTKAYGPYFYYCNNVTNSLTSTNQAAMALYNDALAQGAAEQSAWPYSWFTNANYTPIANRGTVIGKMVISDGGNANASAANLWVGVVQQPAVDVSHDFQSWAKPYQFWVKTDSNANFIIPGVIAGANYTLFAFGSGASGTFQSQNLTGGNPPLLYDLPTSPFSVTVNGGATNNLGTITWIPSRVGATVFEIGYPDRTAAKFRHGDDYWVGDSGPSAAAPSPIWSKWLEYPFDFPNGVNYTVGQSRWSTDWNFCQPVVTDSQGIYNDSTSTITFNLATAPTNGATASLYIGLTSDFYAAVKVNVNGNNLGSVGGVTALPRALPTTGYVPAYSDSDTTIREGNNGAFTDERITFPASQLHAGNNTITFTTRQVGGSSFADHFMYDYLRLELTGYVPPSPASVTAYAGNNCNLICWPAAPGATTYNILRSTTSGTGYVSITNGVIGPVCGSGSNNATYLDATAANGTTNYYVVRSVNPTGSSTNSPPSSAAVPSAGLSALAPAAPTGLSVTSVGHQSVTLNWNASSGANYYSIWRSTLVNTGGGSSNTLGTILLNNATTSTTYTDISPTDGTIHRYFLTAASAGGISGNSTSVVGVALPTAPASKPGSLTANFYQNGTTNIVLNWNAVSGAVGYLIKRATSAGGPFTFLASITETVYYDIGLSASATYYYQVIAVNAGGVSITATNSANGLQPAPASLSAVGDDQQIILSWPAASGATSYTLKRGISSGNETTTVISGYAGITYTNTGLVNETTYFYVLTATGPGGTSGSSVEASATASAASSSTWAVDANGNWNTAANWSDGLIAFGPGNTADFSALTLTANRTVTLDSDRTLSGLTFGDHSSSFNWTLAGTNKLAFGASPNINVVNQSATVTTVIAGSAGLTKTGLGTLILGGATETVSNGIAVNAGTLSLDFSASGSPLSALVPSQTLTFAGGSLTLTGGPSMANSQAFGTTTLNNGNATITSAPGAGGTASLTLANLSRPSNNTLNGGSARFSTNGTITVSGTISSTLLVDNQGNPYATYGLSDWAGTDGSGNVMAASLEETINANVTWGTTHTSAGPLKFDNSSGAIQLTLRSGATYTIQGGYLMTPNSKGVTIQGGASGGGTSWIRPFKNTGASGSDVTVIQNSTQGDMIFGSLFNIPNGGASGALFNLVKSGAGRLIAGQDEGYSKVFLNEGILQIIRDGQIGTGTGAVEFYGGTLEAAATAAFSSHPFNLNTPSGISATAGNTATLNNSIAGSGGLFIGGIPGDTGTVIVSNYNTFTGDITVNTGTLGVSLNNNLNNPTTGPLGNTSVARKINVNSGATLNFILGNALGSTLTTPGATLVINSGGTVSNTASDIETLGPVQLNGGILTGAGGAYAAFQMYDLRGTVTVGGSSPSTISGPGNASSGYHLAAPTIFNVADSTGDANSDLNVTAILVDQDGAGTAFGHLGAAGSLTKTGAGTLTLSATNAYTGGTTNNAGIVKVNAPETPGISGPLGKSGTLTFGGGTLQYSAANQSDYSSRFSAAANQPISIDTAGQDVTFASPLVSSGGSLTKLGNGTLTLVGANSYSGGTFISSGKLAVNNPNGSGTGSGNVTVHSGGTLTGTGKLGGLVTVAAGGTLALGNQLSALTVSNNLTLAEGSTTFMSISHASATNSSVRAVLTLTCGGALVVTNLSGTLTANDTFNLFNAASYAGSFSTLVLPALGSGLLWDTSALNTSGSLSVMASVPPVFNSVAQLGDGTLRLNFSGTAGAGYEIRASTNLTLSPVTLWTLLGTGTFGAAPAIFDDVLATNYPQRFYQIRLP